MPLKMLLSASLIATLPLSDAVDPVLAKCSCVALENQFLADL